jgi:hypothetical protein
VRVIIAGSREITDFSLVERAVEQSGFRPSVVISGRCRGVDLLGERWARKHRVPLETFPAAWRLYGDAAGPLRNGVMVSVVEGLIVIWDGLDTGSADVFRRGLEAGLHVFEVRVRGGEIVHSEAFGPRS